METAPALPVQCDHSIGCITCGDEAVAMHVVRLEADEGLAACREPGGPESMVEVSLVAPVESGDALLVHAGVALQRLDAAELEPAEAA